MLSLYHSTNEVIIFWEGAIEAEGEFMRSSPDWRIGELGPELLALLSDIDVAWDVGLGYLSNLAIKEAEFTGQKLRMSWFRIALQLFVIAVGEKIPLFLEEPLFECTINVASLFTVWCNIVTWLETILKLEDWWQMSRFKPAIWRVCCLYFATKALISPVWLFKKSLSWAWDSMRFLL